jgi:hypothetical protein
MLPFKSKWSHYLATSLVVCCTAGSIVQFQLIRLAVLEQNATQNYSKEEYLREERLTAANLNVLQKFPKSGFENLIAGWTFINFLQYFGDNPARKNTGYKITPDFFEIIVKKDPLFLDMYSYLSPSVTLFAGQPQQSVSMLEKGLKVIPPVMQSEAFFLWQAKGTDELLFLGQNNSARKSYEKAADWASLSPDPQVRSIAGRSLQTARFLASNPDSRRARVASWFNILTNAIDDSTRQFAVQQITALGGKISVAENGALQVKLPKQD